MMTLILTFFFRATNDFKTFLRDYLKKQKLRSKIPSFEIRYPATLSTSGKHNSLINHQER